MYFIGTYLFLFVPTKKRLCYLRSKRFKMDDEGIYIRQTLKPHTRQLADNQRYLPNLGAFKVEKMIKNR